MKPKFALALGLCALLALTTVVILFGRGRRSSPSQKTQNVIVTQDGKLTVLSPEANANWKVVVTAKSITNTFPALTNSATK